METIIQILKGEPKIKKKRGRKPKLIKTPPKIPKNKFQNVTKLEQRFKISKELKKELLTKANEYETNYNLKIKHQNKLEKIKQKKLQQQIYKQRRIIETLQRQELKKQKQKQQKHQQIIINKQLRLNEKEEVKNHIKALKEECLEKYNIKLVTYKKSYEEILYDYENIKVKYQENLDMDTRIEIVKKLKELYRAYDINIYTKNVKELTLIYEKYKLRKELKDKFETLQNEIKELEKYNENDIEPTIENITEIRKYLKKKQNEKRYNHHK